MCAVPTAHQVDCGELPECPGVGVGAASRSFLLTEATPAPRTVLGGASVLSERLWEKEGAGTWVVGACRSLSVF